MLLVDAMFVIFLPSMVAEIVVAAMALAYTLFSVAIQRKLSDPVRLQEIQLRMSAISKELNAMVRNNASKEAIAAKQKEIMPMMGESMKAQFKPMFIILPLFFLVYYVLVPYVPLGFKAASVQQAFFVMVVIFGLILSTILLIKDKEKAKKRINTQSSAPIL
jgi:uncharacterized membrane protein (DUF106 family)